MNLSFQKTFYGIATVFALFAILILGKTILIPLAFAVLVSFILFPLASKFESWGMNKLLAVFLSIFSVIMIIGGGIFLFSTQILGIAKDFSDIQDRILLVLADATLYTNNNLNFVPNLEKGELYTRIKEWVTVSAGSLVRQTFSSTASFIAGLVLTIIYTFLILIYRDGMVHAFTWFFPEEKRERAMNMFRSIQQVGKKYLSGMMLVIIILGLINSFGLLIIGIEHPFLFGFLASCLAIIPYVGTTLGAAIPVLYAFVSYDSIWKAIAVAIMFWSVQVVESNFLTPRIVGGNLKVNALSAILSILVGAAVWGVAGMILFLPFAAMLRVFCEQFEELKAIGLLIGEHNNPHEQKTSSKFLAKITKSVKSWFAK